MPQEPKLKIKEIAKEITPTILEVAQEASDADRSEKGKRKAVKGNADDHEQLDEARRKRASTQGKHCQTREALNNSSMQAKLWGVLEKIKLKLVRGSNAWRTG